MSKNSILEYWPFPYPMRNNQEKALLWLEDNIDKKYFILESPVGGGKSNVAITFSHYLKNIGDSLILTPQRILQAQYERSFKDNDNIELSSLYGKSNYKCHERTTTCNIGSLFNPKCSSCPYKNAVRQASTSSNTVLNYKLGLLAFKFTEIFKPRNLLILDECHQLENHLVEFDSINITERLAKRYNVLWAIQKDFDAAVHWMNTIYRESIKKYIQDNSKRFESIQDKAGDNLDQDEIRFINYYEKAKDDAVEIAWFVNEHEKYNLKKEFVYIHDMNTMKFKRLTGHHSFKTILEPIADKFLFMSSTILNHKGFCRDIGIDLKETAFTSLDSDFPPEKRPVFYIPTAKMNVKWNTDENTKDRKELLSKIKEICSIHENESGIVHTGNFAIASWLVEELEDVLKHQIYHHNPSSGDDRNSVIDVFMQSKTPGLLISPSITEGLDLKEDIARFAIFVKVPYGYLGDQWIKRRMELSSEWYARMALTDIIQGCGRVVRSESDWGYVYILDTSWQFLYNKNRHMIPKWWNTAYRKIGN